MAELTVGATYTYDGDPAPPIFRGPMFDGLNPEHPQPDVELVEVQHGWVRVRRIDRPAHQGYATFDRATFERRWRKL